MCDGLSTFRPEGLAFAIIERQPAGDAASFESDVGPATPAPTGVPAKLKRRSLTGRAGIKRLLPYLAR
jgi:hypothetical protein